MPTNTVTPTTTAPPIRPEAEATLYRTKGSRIVTTDELAEVPTGPPAGPRHRPVQHAALVAAVRDAFAEHGYDVAREQYSLSHDGARLFGALDLAPTTGAPLTRGLEGGMAVGLRHANDQAFALGVIAGLRVFVCDNLAFNGSSSVLHRKHTTGLDLVAEARRGVERSFGGYDELGELIERLGNTELSEAAAKTLIYELSLEGGVIAPSQLGKVHAWYFCPEQIASPSDLERGLDDVCPRTAQGVMSAVTRVTRELPPHRQQEIGVGLSRYLSSYFRMPAKAPAETDAN